MQGKLRVRAMAAQWPQELKDLCHSCTGSGGSIILPQEAAPAPRYLSFPTVNISVLCQVFRFESPATPPPATSLLSLGPPRRHSKASTARRDQAPKSLSQPHLVQIPAAKPLSPSSYWDVHLLSSQPCPEVGDGLACRHPPP